MTIKDIERLNIKVCDKCGRRLRGKACERCKG